MVYTAKLAAELCSVLIALAGFAAISAANPHRHSHHGQAPINRAARDTYTEYVTKTVPVCRIPLLVRRVRCEWRGKRRLLRRLLDAGQAM
jgi:hypothetical protein